jgi:hypothetical protein
VSHSIVTRKLLPSVTDVAPVKRKLTVDAKLNGQPDIVSVAYPTPVNVGGTL